MTVLKSLVNCLFCYSKAEKGVRFSCADRLARPFCNYVVIEGIETKEEWAIVKASHADAAQGTIFHVRNRLITSIR